MKKLLLATVLAIAPLTFAHATEEQATAMGPGVKKCSEFLDVLSGKDDDDKAVAVAVYFSWAEGFMSAVNVIHVGTDNIVKNLHPFSISEKLAHIATYCAEQPDKEFANAVADFYGDLPDYDNTGE